MQVLQGNAVGPVVRPKFPERINAKIAQIGAGVVTIDSPLVELLIRHAVILASVCEKLVGKDLGYPERRRPSGLPIFSTRTGSFRDGTALRTWGFWPPGGDEQVAAFALRNQGNLPKVKHVSVVGK